MAIFNDQKFISVLTAGASANSGISITITDKTFQNSLTFSPSGLTGFEDEKTLAYQTATQLSTYLTQVGLIFTTDYALTGVPYYVDLPPVQCYNVTLTDHCICIWGQSMFDVSVNSTMGNIIQVGNVPTLVTITDCREIASITGLDLTNNDDDDLTDWQLGTILKLASAKLVGFLNNKIVNSTYLQEETTSWVWGIFLKKTPVTNFVPPQVRQPIAFNLFSAITYSTVKSNYSLEPDTGMFSYRFAQSLVDYVEPFSNLNDVIIVYTAGWPSIPEDIKNSIVQIIPVIQGQYLAGVKSIKGGSFSIEYGGLQELYNQVVGSLRQYYNQS